MEDQAHDLADLGSALNAMMNEWKSIPPVIGPQANQQDDSTMLTTGTMSQTELIRLMKQVIEETAQQGTSSTNKTKSGTSGRRKEWVKYNCWCWTYGTNTSHNSPECNKRAPGHKVSATKDDPMGGNVKRDHMYMKWSSPSGTIHDTKGEE